MRLPRNLLLSTCLLSPLASLASAGAGQCTGVVGELASAVVGDVVAKSFCSSKYPQPAQTITLSQNASTVTSTVTITTVGSPITITVNGTATTRTKTVATTTVIASIETDRFTETSTETDFTTSITTYISTYITTNTTTLTITPNQKRDLIGAKLSFPTIIPIKYSNATTVTKPSAASTLTIITISTKKSTTNAAVTTAKPEDGMVSGLSSEPAAHAAQTLFGTVSSIASAICKCIETPRTSIVTLTATTNTVTITSTKTSTPTSTATATPTVTSSVTATVSTVSTTDTTSETTTFTTSTDIVTTSTTDTSTVTLTTTTTLPICNPSSASFQSKAGCKNNCYCNVDSEGVAFCDDDTGSRSSCSKSADCPNNEVCDIGDIGNSSGVGYCVTNPANNSCGGLA